MIRQILFTLLTVFACYSNAQTIKGNVSDAETGDPIPFANVFFTGSLIGTTTDLKGNFSLEIDEEGKYDMAVTFIGYQEYFNSIQSGIEIPFLKIRLQPETIELRDVYVKADTAGWRLNYQSFKPLFLGESINAKNTDIQNPSDIFLYYDQVEKVLVAHAKKELAIDNFSLGYRLIYLIKEFEMNYNTGSLRSFGIPRFQLLESKNNRQQRQWEKERLRAYNGSFTHFLNVLKGNTMSEEGFVVYELYKVKNPERPSQELIDSKLSDLKSRFRKRVTSGGALAQVGVDDPLTDSIRYWSATNRMVEYKDSLGLKYEDNSLLLDDDGNLSYTGYLRILYLNEPEEEGFSHTRRGGGTDTKQTSDVYFREPLVIHENGYYDTNSVLFLGYWGWSAKLAEMLPLNYDPRDVEE